MSLTSEKPVLLELLPATSVDRMDEVAVPLVDGVNEYTFVSKFPLPGVEVVASVCVMFEPPFAKLEVVTDAPPEPPVSVTAARILKVCAPAPAEPL